MSLSNSAENNLMLLLFNNTNWANVGDATGVRGASTAGNFYISLHTADPGETGDQTTSEIAFTGYARQAVARASGAGGWTVSADTASNTSTITFPTMTGGAGGTATFFVIGRAISGAGEIIVSGALTNNVVISLGNPVASFAASALTATAA